MMRSHVKKRYLILVLSILILCVTGWLELFFLKRQHLIGGGISRTFLFLLINAHLVLSVILLFLIIRQSIKLYIERKKRVPGSAFKKNLFFAFIVFSVIPTTFVFFVAGKLITKSIDSWFTVRVVSGLENGIALHQQQTKQDRTKIAHIGSLVAKEITRCKDERALRACIMNLQNTHGYEIQLWGSNGEPVIGSIRNEIRTWRTFRKVNDRSTTHLTHMFLQKFRTSKKPFDFYGSLYWTQPIDDAMRASKVLVLAYRYPPHIRYPLIDLENALADYAQLRSIRGPIYWNYFFAFLLITLLILFMSIWCALYLARGISKPIQDLMIAVKKIRGGDLHVRVTHNASDDLCNLVNGFNEMTDSLQRAYTHLEFRNEEMFTMLEHIRESVFFVNNHGRIVSFNAAAKKIVDQYFGVSRFKHRKVSILGAHVRTVFFELMRELITSDKNDLSKEISFSHEGEAKTFRVYMTVIQNAVLATSKGVLVVVEDLSEVYKMNKIKTWQEAAKQMAHEIKNPLTPIQLATQRLQRKLRRDTEKNYTVHMECIETILHQVKIIKDLVGHFSEFAKMPGSVIEPLDINSIVHEVGSLYKMSYPDISFCYDLHKFLPSCKADRKKIKRVMVNLLDNSVRALQGFDTKEIKIKTNFKTGRNQIELLITDNGPGIPKDVREKLFLPYVSSGNKNMGLGLAIVHDIVSQAGGSIKLLPSAHGATFQILLTV